MKQLLAVFLIAVQLASCHAADANKKENFQIKLSPGQPDSLPRNFVNVMDFGVINGDTAADNSAAIMKAIEHAHANKIVNVLLPSWCRAHVKTMIFIPYPDIHFYLEGWLIGRPGARDQPNAVNHGVIMAGKKVSYYGGVDATLSNIWICGGGGIDLRQVPRYWNAEAYANGKGRPWQESSTVQLLQVQNGKVEDLTILGSFASAISVMNGRNVVVQRNNLKGLRPTAASATMMHDGNLVNIGTLDPGVDKGDSSFFSGVQVLYNIIDGKNDESPWPFTMQGVTPDGANIGINIALEPFTAGSGHTNAVLVYGNTVRHCIWGIANEGQFVQGSQHAFTIQNNFVSDCLIGIASVTNTQPFDNANFISIKDNSIENCLGDAIQCYGNHVQITGNMIRNWGLAKKGNSMSGLMQNNTNIGAAIHVIPFSQAANKPATNGDIVIDHNTAYMNVKHDSSTYFSSICGIDIQLNHAGQVAQNLHITNNILNGGGSNVYHADGKRNAGITLRGGMNNVKITGNTFTGFAGPGLSVLQPDASGSVADAPANVLLEGNSFIDNDLRPQYSFNAVILLSGNCYGWTISNNYFRQKNRKLNYLISILPDYQVKGFPKSKVSDVLISNNRYDKSDFTKSPDVYDITTSGENVMVASPVPLKEK